MSAEIKIPQPPPELIAEGANWILRQDMSEKSSEMEKKLKQMFGTALEIYRVHMGKLRGRIEEKGGVSRIVDEYYFLCNNGERIYAQEALSTPVLSKILQVPKDLEGLRQKHVRQKYEIEVLYGNNFPSERSTYICSNQLPYGTLRDFLDPKFHPNDICIGESVTSYFRDWSETYSRFYSLNAAIWEPSLPNDDGERVGLGYAVADMNFTATRESRGKNGKLNQEMFTYVRHGSLKDSVDPSEVRDKLLRFSELLAYCHEKIVGVGVGASAHPAEVPQLSPASES
jgi:hypothetical protein